VKLQVLYFARLREALQCAQEQVEVPVEVCSVGALRAWLCARGGRWPEALADGGRARAAVDKRMAGEDAALSDGTEVAFFPPVTGG
jgi:molybdopterin synthase sulfur carrier subunit